MATAQRRTVQLPGEPAQTLQAAEAAEAAESAGMPFNDQADAAEGEQQPPAETKDEQIARMLAERDAMQQQIDQLTRGQFAGGKNKRGENLPDPSTIDPTKIKTPVLSRTGWVVPITFRGKKEA